MNKRFLLLIAFSLINFYALAQIALPTNLMNVKSSDVTENQVERIAQGMIQQNATSSFVKDELIKRGMSGVEADLLITRIESALALAGANMPKTENSTGNMNNTQNSRYKNQDSIAIRPKQVANPKKIFGLEIFNNGALTFEPNLRIATPKNYIVGPDDEITISIYGYQEANYKLTVSPEGDIVIPFVGSIYLSGLTIEQANKKIKDKLAANGYSNIRTGLTKLNISVSKIRSIRVSVIGEVVKPGTYTLSSLATAFNALYLSGGPNEIGSMRNIEILRGGKIIERLDVYDFLLNEGLVGNIQLRDQDIIRIPAYNVRVSIEGQVKRTGLFEVKKNESLQDILRFAGGFTDSAYKASIQSNIATDTARRIIDIPKSQYSLYKPTEPQSFWVKKIIERYSNRVNIKGAVYLPGSYELTPNMTLKDLILKAEGPTDTAYYKRALLVRQKKDSWVKEYISFDLTSVLNGDTTIIYLEKDDEITIGSKADLVSTYSVTINGEVKEPSNYFYAENMTLKDLIFLAGGFTDAAVPQRIEIGRRITNNYDTVNLKIANVLNISSVNDLNSEIGDVVLEPWDIVTVRRNPGYKSQINVSVWGEVVFPGPYVIESAKDRISDLIKRAGGFTPQAFPKGVYLSRINQSTIKSELDKDKVFKIANNKSDSISLIDDLSSVKDQIAINLEEILKNPNVKSNLILQEGDVLTVLREKTEVRVSGEVLFPTQVVHEKNMNLKEYIGKAGGFTDAARKGRVYVLYPNGSIAKTSNFLFFKSYPKITPGAEVIVPKKVQENRNKLTIGELIGLTAALASVATVVIAATNTR